MAKWNPPPKGISVGGKAERAHPTDAHSRLKSPSFLLPELPTYPHSSSSQDNRRVLEPETQMYLWSSSSDSVKESFNSLSVFHLCLSHLVVTSPCLRMRTGRDNLHIVQSCTLFTSVLIAPYNAHAAACAHTHTHTHISAHISSKHAHEMFPTLILHQAA